MAAVNANRFKTDKNGRVYIVVISGDTLSEIAQAYRSAYNKTTTYQQIAAMNKIADANFIVVGQTIYLSEASGGTTPSTKQEPESTRSVTITQFGLLAGGVTNELYATWTWSKEGDTEEYDIEWKWYRAGVWKYSDSTEIRRYSTFTIPDDGITSKIQFRVRPVPKVDKVNDKEVARFATNLWTDWNECTYNVVNKPDVPSGLKVELNDLSLTATITNVDKTKVSLIEFKLVKDGNDSTASTAKSALDDTGEASHTFTVLAGSTYKVCCRSYKDNNYSEWSDYTDSVETKPAKVELKDPVPKSTTSIYLEWSKSATATGYVLAYTNDTDGFYEGAQITDVNVEGLNYTANGLSTGATYHFRVKAVKATNNGTQESDWSEVKTCAIGSDPTAPTTWSSTTTAIADEGETVSLYWMHNSTDGSAQKSAEVSITFEGIDNISLVKNDVSVELGKIESIVADGNTVKYTITASTAESDQNKTHSLIIDTHNYDDGAIITWNVVTIGTTDKASEASMNRVVNIYSRPTAYLTVTDTSSSEVGDTYYTVEYLAESDAYVKTPETIEMVAGSVVSGRFTVTGEQVRTATVNSESIYYCVVEKHSLTVLPFNVNVQIDTNTEIQTPIEYHLTVNANESYETVDNFGNPKIVTPEEMLYSKHFSAASDSMTLNTKISAQDVSLSNGQSYTVKCVVAMSSGLTVEAVTEMVISWASTSYDLNAEIGLDRTNCSVYIRPYCEAASTSYYRVTYSGGRYTVDTATQYSYVYGSPISNTTTTSGDQVYYGTTPAGESTYYTIKGSLTAIDNVLLAVYRREYDGTFTEIISGLEASKKSFVTDPHPSLDFARYRVTAMDKATGVVSYADISNYPIGEKALIIQWNEPYVSYEVSEDEMEVSNKSETLLRLPYNIDVTTSRDPDVSLIKYIGRKHPVSYYGTQVGEKATWSTTIPKSDTETLYTLQRLQAWTGDVYVREPYGTGYWANVKVSMSRTHLETVVPVTLDITRVEGGI